MSSTSSTRDSHALFHETVHELAAEPTPANVRRYLAASRLLDRDRATVAGRLRPGTSEATVADSRRKT
jgi:hypothetical protein